MIGPEEDFEDMSLMELTHLASRGNIGAQVSLGYRYGNGDGVPEDHGQAFSWWLEAAKQGDGTALYNLGIMYLNGDYVESSRGRGSSHTPR